LIQNLILAIENKDFNLAIKKCNELLEKNSENSVLYEIRAKCYQNIGQIDSAIEDLGTSISKFQGDDLNHLSELFQNRGKLFLSVKKYDQAVKDLKFTLDYRQDNSEVNFMLAQCYKKLNHNDFALVYVNKVIEAEPSNADAYNLKANILYLNGNEDEAIQSYSKALEINPDFPKAYFNRGLIYFERGEKEKSIEDFKKSIGLNPEYKNELEKIIPDFNKFISPEKESVTQIVEPIPPVTETISPIIETNPPEIENQIAVNVKESVLPENTVNIKDEFKDKTEPDSRYNDLFTQIEELNKFQIPKEEIKEDIKEDIKENIKDEIKENIPSTEKASDDIIIPEFNFKSIFEENKNEDLKENVIENAKENISEEIKEVASDELNIEKPIVDEKLKSLHEEILSKSKIEVPETNLESNANINKRITILDEPIAFEKISETKNTVTDNYISNDIKKRGVNPILKAVFISIILILFVIGLIYFIKSLIPDVKKGTETLLDTNNLTSKYLASESDTNASSNKDTITNKNDKDSIKEKSPLQEEKKETVEEKPVTQNEKQEPIKEELPSKNLGYLSSKNKFVLLSEKDGYYVQLSSYKDKKSAEKDLILFKAKNIPVNIYEADLKEKGIYYRVRAGAFSSEEEARNTLKSFE